MSPRIYFEPIGEEIECGEEEAVLDAAFRQGYNLVYGCREGQCSACKSYILEGEVFLKPYSTFALSDSEESQGYTLLCRAMPETDLVIELLHYDPDHYRLENPIQEGVAHIEAIDALTHDIRRLLLAVREPEDLSFVPGQYVDLHVPGTEGERRSFSMANLPGGRELELIIKRYPDGRFSSLLDGELKTGDELGFTGPYGAFHLRESDRPALLVAGGSGMAPVLSVLRQMAGERTARKVRFFYGARARHDLFYTELVEGIGDSIEDFRFVPVLSEAAPDEEWSGEEGFVHEAVDRYLAGGEMGDDLEAYMCGPPPMIEAASELLEGRYGIPGDRIFWDKFTITAEAESVAPDSSSPPPLPEDRGTRP